MLTFCHTLIRWKPIVKSLGKSLHQGRGSKNELLKSCLYDTRICQGADHVPQILLKHAGGSREKPD